jgi:hypothetical protein
MLLGHPEEKNRVPKFIASYDLIETKPDPHKAFLENAKKHGWGDAWIKGENGKWYRLPNTTLVGTFGTRDEAVAALKATKADTEKEIRTKVTMEKWIVADYTNATFDSDVKTK